MKKTAIIFTLAFSVSAEAADVSLQWDKSLDHDKVATYRLYTKKPADVLWSAGKDVGLETKHLIANVPAGKTMVAVTAFSAELGESLKSNEVTVTMPPSAPTGLRIVVTIEVH